jgi:MFS family permease
MVPPMAAVAGPLSRRFGPGPVAALGNLLFGAGLLIWGLSTGLTPHYASEMLPGYLVGGIGAGQALPTLTAAGATALPPNRFATGSGILTMARQVGAVLGVAVIVVIIGTPHTPAATRTAFHDGWFATAAVSALAALVALAIKPSAPSLPAPESAATRRPTALADHNG